MKLKKTIIRPSAGQPLRPSTDSPRNKHLFVELYKDEKKEILEYCIRHKKSVSQFLAEVALEAAENEDEQKPAALTLSVPGQRPDTIAISNDDLFKLELLGRAQKKPVLQVILERIVDKLRRQPATVQDTEAFRYYLSPNEHETIRDHHASKGVSGRSYVAMLALKKVRADKK